MCVCVFVPLSDPADIIVVVFVRYDRPRPLNRPTASSPRGVCPEERNLSTGWVVVVVVAHTDAISTINRRVSPVGLFVSASRLIDGMMRDTRKPTKPSSRCVSSVWIAGGQTTTTTTTTTTTNNEPTGEENEESPRAAATAAGWWISHTPAHARTGAVVVVAAATPKKNNRETDPWRKQNNNAHTERMR